MNDRILQFLTDNKDDKYADFQRTLITSAYPIIGVRTPLLKKRSGNYLLGYENIRISRRFTARLF